MLEQRKQANKLATIALCVGLSRWGQSQKGRQRANLHIAADFGHQSSNIQCDVIFKNTHSITTYNRTNQAESITTFNVMFLSRTELSRQSR